MSTGRSLLLLAAAIACGKAHEQSMCGRLGLTQAQCADVQGLRLLDALPPSRGNAVADNPNAANMGFHVFFDARFSSAQTMRCATCHAPESNFQDNASSPQAIAATFPRKAPTLLNAAWMGFQFWDGRADSVWSQPLYAFENPLEMGFSRLQIAHLVQQLYRAQYEAIFGPMPDLSDPSRFPAQGAPGSPLWDGMAPDDRDAVQRIVANVGKTIEAYERKIASGKSRLDGFLAGDPAALTAQEQRGLSVFASAGCLSCHSGPMLSDGRFHDLGVPPRAGHLPDRGRATGLAMLLQDPFNAHGPYFDGPVPSGEDALYQPAAQDEGAFRTPPLRNLLRNAPYGHDGSFATLDQVVDFHLGGGGRGQSGFAGNVDAALVPRQLSAADRAALLAFLRTLEGVYPSLPWADWPRG